MGNSDKGIVLVLLLIVLTGLIALAALAIDTWRLLHIARQAQDAADAASVAGTSQLYRSSPILRLQSVDSWKNVKKAILSSVAHAQIFGLTQEAVSSIEDSEAPGSFRFNDVSGAATNNDAPQYSRDKGSAGNLSILVRRGIWCYQSAAKKVFISLEDKPNYWCTANAVEVKIILNGVEALFARAIGTNALPGVQVSATTFLKPTPSICGFPMCHSVGIGADNKFTITTPSC